MDAANVTNNRPGVIMQGSRIHQGSYPAPPQVIYNPSNGSTANLPFPAPADAEPTISTVNDKVSRVEALLLTFCKEMRAIKSAVDNVQQSVFVLYNIQNPQKVGIPPTPPIIPHFPHLHSNHSIRIEISKSGGDGDDRGDSDNSIIHSATAAAPDKNISSGNGYIDSGGVSESDMTTGEINHTSHNNGNVNVNHVDQSENVADENYPSYGNLEEMIFVSGAGEIASDENQVNHADSDTAAVQPSETFDNNVLGGTLSDEHLINDSHDPSVSEGVGGVGGSGERGNGNNIGSTLTDDDDDEVQIIDVVPISSLLRKAVVGNAMGSGTTQHQTPLVTIDGWNQNGGDGIASGEVTNDRNMKQEMPVLEPEISDLNTIFEPESFTQDNLSVGAERSTTSPRKSKSDTTADKAKKKRICGIRPQAPAEEVQPGTSSSFLENARCQQSRRSNSNGNNSKSSPSTSSSNFPSPPPNANEGGMLTPAQIKREREAHALQRFDTVTNKWVCVCGHETQTKTGLVMHVTEHGTEVPRYKCPECPQRFKFVFRIKNHLIKKHEYRQLPRDLPRCKICFKVVLHRRQLLNHRNERGKLCIPRRLRIASEAEVSSDTGGGGAVIPEGRQEPKVPSITIRLRP